MVVHREEKRRDPQHRRHRHSHAPLLPRQGTEHGGIDGEEQYIVGKINFPVCILAKELEEVADQRQAGVLGNGPRRAQRGGGVQAVIHLGDLDGSSPKRKFIGHRCHRLAHKEVDGKRQRQHPEGHAAGGCQLRVVALFILFRRQQRPHAAHRTQGIQRPCRRVQHPGHTGQRQHRRNAGKRDQRGQPGRDPGFERKRRAAQKQRRQRRHYAEKFHFLSLSVPFLIRKGTKRIFTINATCGERVGCDDAGCRLRHAFIPLKVSSVPSFQRRNKPLPHRTRAQTAEPAVDQR